MDTAKKNCRRFQQRLHQNLGLSEKTQVVSDDVLNIEEKTKNISDVLTVIRQKLSECLRSRSKEEVIGKRRKKLVEYQLALAFSNESRSLTDMDNDSLLSQILVAYADSLTCISDELVKSELNIEKRTLEQLTKFSDEFKCTEQQKDKLDRAVLDMDSTRSRMSNAQNKNEKWDQLQDELDSRWNKVESLKDSWESDLYTLAGKELELSNTFHIMIKLQMDFYKTAYETLQNLLPVIQTKIDHYPKRPVFGCPLADHLRYAKRDVSIVLEVCCSALCELGLKEEGLFRVSGTLTKIKKLKAAFDIDEIDLSDMDNHAHSIAGALKMYLRELPEPLMTYNLYTEWMKAASVDGTENRLAAIKDVINRMPVANATNLRYLMRFLGKLVENQQFTKMSSQNLAIVMAPNILWSPNNDGGFQDNACSSTLVDCLISNADYFFPGETRFTSPRISSLINRTGGFMDELNITSFVPQPQQQHQQQLLSNRSIPAMEESTRSISPPSDESIAGNASKTNNVQTSSLTRRPKQPAPPPPVVVQLQETAVTLASAAPKTPPDDPMHAASDTADRAVTLATAPVVEPPLRTHRKTESFGGGAEAKSRGAQLQSGDAKPVGRNIATGSLGRCGGDFVAVTEENTSKQPSRPPLPSKEKLVERRSSQPGQRSSMVVNISDRQSSSPPTPPNHYNRGSNQSITIETPPCEKTAPISVKSRIAAMATVVSVNCDAENDGGCAQPRKSNADDQSCSSLETTPKRNSFSPKQTPSAAPRFTARKLTSQSVNDEEKPRTETGLQPSETSLQRVDVALQQQHPPPPRPKPPVPSKPNKPDEEEALMKPANATRL